MSDLAAADQRNEGLASYLLADACNCADQPSTMAAESHLTSQCYKLDAFPQLMPEMALVCQKFSGPVFDWFVVGN